MGLLMLLNQDTESAFVFILCHLEHSCVGRHWLDQPPCSHGSWLQGGRWDRVLVSLCLSLLRVRFLPIWLDSNFEIKILIFILLSLRAKLLLHLNLFGQWLWVDSP
jgi:hypothetical protein